MFGHDNQSKQDDNATPAITPAPDDLVNETDDQASATGAPAFDTASVSLGASPAPAPAATNEPADTPAPSAPASTPEENLITPSADDDLLRIKQDALQQLSPLVGHLEQTPEEKFRTTMMMIQASDDQSLVKSAYEAAREIKDDKVRAQALLDIINEINYFTQQNSNGS